MTAKKGQPVSRAISKREHSESFEQILLESIDEALSGLGIEVKTSIYFYLESIFKIKKEEIPMRIEDFSSALEQIFDFGFGRLEILCMKRLYDRISLLSSKAGVELEAPTLTFQEYVRIMKRRYEEASEKDSVEFSVDVGEKQEQYM